MEGGGGGEEEGVVVTRSVYRATCHPLYQRVSRRRQKLRRIGRDWGLAGVGDTAPLPDHGDDHGHYYHHYDHHDHHGYFHDLNNGG